MSVMVEEDEPNFKRRLLSKQSGAIVEVIDHGILRKKGEVLREAKKRLYAL